MVIQQNSSRFQSLRSPDVENIFLSLCSVITNCHRICVCVCACESYRSTRKQNYKTIKLKRSREICIAIWKEHFSNGRPKQTLFFKHVRRNIFYSKNYLFGFVSALTVSCMLLRCAVQYESFQNAHFFFRLQCNPPIEQQQQEWKKKINNFWLLETCHCASRAIETNTRCICMCSDLRMSEVFEWFEPKSFVIKFLFFFLFVSYLRCVSLCGTLVFAFLFSIEKSNVERAVSRCVCVCSMVTFFLLLFRRNFAFYSSAARVCVLSWLCKFFSE